MERRTAPNKTAILALIFALLIILGCGGGGGGINTTGGTTSGNTSAPQAGQYLEFLVNGVSVDPMNLRVGDVAQVVAVNYDPAGTRTVLAASNFSLTGATGSVATLNNAGVLTIVGQATGTFVVQASVTLGSNTVTVQMAGFVPASTALTRIAGNVRSTTGNLRVGYVTVQFWDQFGNLVGGARTNGDGTFNGLALSTATRLTLRPQSIPSTYYAAIRYQNVNYATIGNACLMPLPSLTLGATNNLPSNVLVPRLVDGPPPPPTGCN